MSLRRHSLRDTVKEFVPIHLLLEGQCWYTHFSTGDPHVDRGSDKDEVGHMGFCQDDEDLKSDCVKTIRLRLRYGKIRL